MNQSIIKEFQAEWRANVAIMKSNLFSQMEQRVAFGMQIIGMIVNNIAFTLMWVLFFGFFGKINNWSIPETILLQGMNALVFGTSFVFAGGIASLPFIINNGSFDALLLCPRRLYIRVLTCYLRDSAIGDILFGLILIVYSLITTHASWIQWIMLFTLVPPAVLIFTNVTLITSLVAFFFPDSERMARSLFEVFFNPSGYPTSLFEGPVRFVLIFILPSLVVAGLPAESVRDISFHTYLLVWLLGIVWTLIGIKLLHLAVRRYESGNLTGARV